MAAKEDKDSCVRALLSHPGIDINIKNNQQCTPMMAAGRTSLGVFKQMFPAMKCEDTRIDENSDAVWCINQLLQLE